MEGVGAINIPSLRDSRGLFSLVRGILMRV